MAGEQPEKRKIAINLTFTTVLTIVFLMVAAMTAAYIWGVMTGRHLAEAPVPASGGSAPQTPQKPVEEMDGILKPQELDFVHALRGDARPVPAKPKQQPQQKTPEASAHETQADAQKAETPPKAAPEAGTEALQDGDAYYDYVFQVAALKDEQAADGLRERLEGHGLRTRLERSGKLFIVLALLRGNSARVAEFLRILGELRLGAPLERSKKLAPRS